jgi:hypothetical protein
MDDDEKKQRQKNPLARFFAYVHAEITAEIVRSLVIAMLLVFVTWLVVYIHQQLQEHGPWPELEELAPVSK